MTEREYDAKDDGEKSYFAAIEAKRLRGDNYYQRTQIQVTELDEDEPELEEMDAGDWLEKWELENER